MTGIDARKLRKALAALPDGEREVFRLCAVEGLGNDAAAQRLGITIAELETQLADALVRLEGTWRGER
jgi:DNA-directed RNA polymerase specialized sigma24 family protein